MTKTTNFMLLTMGIMLLIGCSFEPLKDKTQQNISDVPAETKLMTQELCESSQGHWNECGSPCAGTDAEMCVAMCEQQCECGGIAGFGCPQGYKCRLTGKIADEMGVCIEE